LTRSSLKHLHIKYETFSTKLTNCNLCQTVVIKKKQPLNPVIKTIARKKSLQDHRTMAKIKDPQKNSSYEIIM
jgi:hypothetical protein